MKKGKVYLVGAGPGDPGLITRKALKCIREADVIIYDHLASESFLNEAGNDAELIYAGKCAGHHHMKQSEIETLLTEKAMEGKNVVRLKGGDPLIFGRGSEEALALNREGIPWEVVPGISSAYSVPAYGGIPVTHRGLASSVHIITGHEKPGKSGSDVDYHTLAKEKGTLVFLMGVSRLGEIAHKLIGEGKAKDTPAAVIQEGTTAHQKMVTGTLENIQDRVQEAGIRPPAIFLVGAVAGLSDKLQWFAKGPLFGQRILLTGTRPLVHTLHERIDDLGGEAFDMSLIQIYPESDEKLSQGLLKETGDLKPFSWIVFTSSNGVRVFFDFIRRQAVDFRQLASVRFAVIGQGTRQCLGEYGFQADLMPRSFTAEALADELRQNVSGSEPILIFRAAQASEKMSERLKEAGMNYTDLAAYATIPDMRKAELLRSCLENVDMITFASASAVKAFCVMTEGMDRRSFGKIVCIGPVTAACAQKQGLDVAKTADIYTTEGLINSLMEVAENGNDQTAETAEEQ